MIDKYLNDRKMLLEIDYKSICVESFTSQLLNNPNVINDYVEILATTLLRVQEILKYKRLTE
jgi:hypothetical protein